MSTAISKLPTDRRNVDEWLRQRSPEVAELPQTWVPKIEDGTKRIYYQKKGGGETSWDHPKLGPLPYPWYLRLCSNPTGGDFDVKYFNPETRYSTSKDPRFQLQHLRASVSSDPATRISSAITKLTKDKSLDDMVRDPVGDTDIRDKFEILHAIDKGDGALGAMNAGVFVARIKGQDRLCVEKRFGAKCSKRLTTLEISMLHRLKHGSLTFYVAAFITSGDEWKASVWVEFCDRGSLQDLIDAYNKKRCTAKAIEPRVPERFLWHAFGGLCDGLAYLQGGRSYISFKNHDYMSKPGWVPIIHRDIKPDNVLLRSRDTLGSRKYFYCVLSDFGLACEAPNANTGGQCGTNLFFAPEQLYDPYPRPPQDHLRFPSGGFHSAKSDLCAVGISIFGLLMADSQAHLNKQMYGKLINSGISSDDVMMGTAVRIMPLEIPQAFQYSTELSQAISTATRKNPQERPEPIQMVQYMKGFMRDSGFISSEWQTEAEKLPEWATRVHEFHTRQVIDPREFRER